MRRYGEMGRDGQKYKTRPGAYAILPVNGKILLTFQGNPHYEIQLPGGGIDAGESPIAALHREVMEETGYRVAAPRLLTKYRRFIYMPEYDLWAEKICHIYVARPIYALGDPSEKSHVPIWAKMQDAAALLDNTADADILRDLTI